MTSDRKTDILNETQLRLFFREFQNRSKTNTVADIFNIFLVCMICLSFSCDYCDTQTVCFDEKYFHLQGHRVFNQITTRSTGDSKQIFALKASGKSFCSLDVHPSGMAN